MQEPPGLNRERWEALVFDAQEHPRPRSLGSLPLGDRQTVVLHPDVVPTIGICVQSPEASDTGKRLEAYADESWWRQQFERWTGLRWNGEVVVSACTGEPPEGWIHVREGKPGEVIGGGGANTRRDFNLHHAGRWLWSEILINPEFVDRWSQSGFEWLLAHQLGHALGFWHVLGAGYVMAPTGESTWPDEESSLAHLAYQVGPNVRYPGLVRSGAEDDANQSHIDRTTLTALYNQTGGNNWTNSTNWVTDEPLDYWHGVTTDEAGRATELSLHANNLSGRIPAELGRLSALFWLDLDQNSLTGPIPPELGDLSALQTLSLNLNNLAGSLPPEVGNLSNLEFIDIYGNSLSGTIPPELGRLSGLKQLILSGNNLTGSIPHELGDLSNMEILQLDNNSLTGSIPDVLGNLSDLTILDVQFNELSGPIPGVLGRLARLVFLDLSHNDLTESVPRELGDLAGLQGLRLAYNGLEGQVPSEFGRLSNLTWLTLDGNRLTGPLPASLTDLRGLDALHIGNNAGLCAPADDAFQEWLATVRDFRGKTCAAEPVPTLTGIWLAVAFLLSGGLGAGILRRRRSCR